MVWKLLGHYWLNIYSKLFADKYVVSVFNPIQSDSIRNFFIRKTKTDSVDSYIIAQVVRIGKFDTTVLSDEKYIALKQLTRFRYYLVDSISDTKRKVISILDQIFPEFASFFSDTFGTTSLALLEEYTTPEDICNLNTQTLYEFLSTKSRGRISYDKTQQLQEIAKNSFGINIATNAFVFEVKQLIAMIKFSEEQLADLDKQISSFFTTIDDNEFITSIPGIGPVLGAVILSEIGDISRFSTVEKLVAFAGLDPTVKQSGNFESTNCKMSKRGSPYLRRAIWQVATISMLHNPTLKEFYDKKRIEGKSHKVAIGHVTNKVLRIIFAVLTSKKKYEQR